jgi:hypothetical protein
VFLRQSNQAEPDFQLYKSDVDELLAKYASQGNFIKQSRGKAGYSVTFFATCSLRGNERAARFMHDVARDTKNIWSVVERPQELRELQGRAHDFGTAFKWFCKNVGCDVNSFYTLHGEFLVIRDIVVAPLPLIPAERTWHDVFCAICDVLESAPVRVNFRQLLVLQLWEYVLEVICAAGDVVDFNTSFRGRSMNSQGSAHAAATQEAVLAKISSSAASTSPTPRQKAPPAPKDAGKASKSAPSKAAGTDGGGKKRRKLDAGSDHDSNSSVSPTNHIEHSGKEEVAMEEEDVTSDENIM